MQRGQAPLMAALSYEAPFLIDKLVQEHIVASRRQGEELVTELLRYLVLGQMYPDKYWYMVSRLVDEAWHQFVLFTKQYVTFCQQYFGHYLHHAPGTSPDAPGLTVVDSFADFKQYYERHFGTPPPELWDDAHWLTLSRRMLVHEALCPVVVARDDRTGRITVTSPRGLVIAVNEIAREAMEFVFRTKAFYVRELPGGLTDQEKLGIAEMLLTRGALMLAT